MKFIILHETKNDDGIKVFFTDLWELYLKVRAPSVAYFPGVQSVSDGHESVPHCAHADTQHGVRQSGEGEREEESVAAGALFAVSSLPLSPIPVLRLLLLSLSLSLFILQLLLFFFTRCLLYHISLQTRNNPKSVLDSTHVSPTPTAISLCFLTLPPRPAALHPALDPPWTSFPLPHP